MSAYAHLLGMYPLGTGPEFDSDSDEDAERMAQAVPPFSVEYQFEDNSVLPERFQPYALHARKYNQGLTRTYNGEECFARVNIFINI